MVCADNRLAQEKGIGCKNVGEITNNIAFEFSKSAEKNILYAKTCNPPTPANPHASLSCSVQAQQVHRQMAH